MATHRPPVIPEIAKAYQNDPRTQLALQAMKAGGSTAPVAQGGWGYLDGIARVLQGMGGAYADKKTQERYGADEATLLAQRQARGVDGLNGAGGPQIASQPPPQAAAVASALGAPPALQTPPMAPGGPMPPQGAPQAPSAPSMAPAVGGGPMGRPPFGSGVNGLAPPVPEAVPNAPPVLQRPNAPEAVGPTRSKVLDAAYRIMSDANPYESASGQDMYASGLSDQDKLNESAAERRQRLTDMGYQSDLGQYADSQEQARADAYQGRRDAQSRNFSADQSFRDRSFRADESSKERAQDTWRTKFSASTQIGLARSAQSFQQAQADRDFEHEKTLKGIEIAGKRSDRAAGFFSTAAGSKIFDANAKTVANANQNISTLNAFEQRLGKTKKVGGVLLGNAPGAVRWANSDYQVLEQLTNQLSLNNSKEMKGSLSDKDIRFLQSMVPSIKNTRAANKDQISFLRGVAQRQRDFAMAQTDAMSNGEGPQFLHNWSAFAESTSANSGITYDQWVSNRPKFDANGNRVK